MLPRLTPSQKRSFETEIVPHLDVLYRMSRTVCDDPDVADDVAQESFLRAMKGFAGFRPGTNGRSWLARIVHNACRDQWRSRGRKAELRWDEAVEAEVDAAAVAAGPWQPEIVRDALDDELDAALQALHPHWRAAVLLVDVEGWSYDEAADALGIATGTLRSSLHRARRVLMDTLTELAIRRGLKTGEAAT